MAKKSKLSGWPDMLSPHLGGFANPLSAEALQSSPMAQSLNNGMDFMKNLWGGVPKAMPGFVLPTMDLTEIDKRISDLRSVESWLELNANMLKATIQGLEVQRNTIAALQSFGAGNNDFMKAMASAAQHPAAVPLADHESAHDDEKEENGQDHHEGWPMPSAMHAAQHARDAHDAASTPAPAAGPAPATAPINPATALGNASAAAWMSFVQQQFAKVAEAAIKSGAPGTPAPVTNAAGKKVAKTAKAAKVAAKGRRATSKKVGQKKAAARRVLSAKA